MCDAHLGGEPTGLSCTRADEHKVGHTYESTSAADDRHPDGGHG